MHSRDDLAVKKTADTTKTDTQLARFLLLVRNIICMTLQKLIAYYMLKNKYLHNINYWVNVKNCV